MTDRFAEIAAILVRDPEPGQLDERGGSLSATELAALMDQRRQQVADRLRVGARQHTDADPVLATLATLHRHRLEAEVQIRLLLAYAREYTEPRPYRLVDLAQATGMSVSGVRTAYADDEIHQVGQAIDRRPKGPR